ncbi:MAG: hypothetical protein WC980_00915 [Candidatus Brocadiia bacterium]
MHVQRLILVIVVITLLGLITVWQQIQTVRLGYQISSFASLKQNLTTENHTLQTKLASTKSPLSLAKTADLSKLKLIYAGDSNITEIKDRITKIHMPGGVVQAKLTR